MKNYIVILFLFISTPFFSQIGNTCGIPSWYSTMQYQDKSIVKYNGVVYKSTIWSENVVPGTTAVWQVLGSCDEQLLIDNPTLAYTACSQVSDWDATKANYDTGNLVRYQNGVYKANYWIAGSDNPEKSPAYTFLGICIIPIDIVPSNADKAIIIKSVLDPIDLTASIDTHTLSLKSSKIEVKKISDANYTVYTPNSTSNSITYRWTPQEYGDYNVRYTCVNSVGVSSVVNTTIKIAISTPPTVSIISPSNNSVFSQLNFSPIRISFKVIPAIETINTIEFTDATAGTSTNIGVSANTNLYNYDWTPKSYGINILKITARDNLGTSTTETIQINVKDPTLEDVSFSALPYQIKAINTINKTFTFDKQISSLKRRDVTLFDFIISGNTLKIIPKREGRSGLVITATDGTKYYLGLRIDNADGTVVKYPNYVAVGSVSEDIDDDVNFYNDGMDNTNLLKNNRMDVRYIYINGGPLIGWNTWQPDRALKFAKNSLKMGLIPFFVFYNIPDGGESYTTDLEHARDPNYMTAYFDNLNLFLNQVKDVVGDEFFGIILEPDFLGYMQQNNEPVSSPTAVSINSIGANVGTLQTLVNRINKEIDAKRNSDKLNMEFGWQLNLWAKPNVAGVRGIIRETDNGDFVTQLDKIKQTAVDIFNYGKNLGIMSYNADFISIDKYGLDAMGAPSSSTPSDPSSYTWFWNNDHWMNYLKFVKALNEVSGKQVILWQVPVGHINGSETINEYTSTNFQTLDNTTKRFEDSASTFFFGDTVNFSGDNNRYNYFSQNKHSDPKLKLDAVNRKITFGNHFEEAKQHGSKLILMGAGVGDSTDGIGKVGTTLTDDHFWIQKLQDYYINNLVNIDSTLGLPDNIKYDSPLIIYPNPVKDTFYINVEAKNIQEIKMIDFSGNVILSLLKHDNKVDISKLKSGVYIIVVKLNNNKLITRKIIKN